MTATDNPSAGPASAAYRTMTDKLGNLGLDTAVPEGVRALDTSQSMKEHVARGVDELRKAVLI